MTTLDQLKAKLSELNKQIETLSVEKQRLETEVKDAERAHAQEAMNKIIGELKALNLDPSEIAKSLGVSVVEPKQRKTRAARGTAAPKVRGVPKYRSSIDPSLTWTGKGRKPGWIQTFLDNGGNLDDWLIKD